MKTRIALLFAFALSLAATALADGPAYSIKAPDGWKKRTGSAALEHYMKNGASLMLTVDSMPMEVKNVDGFVEYAKKQLLNTFKTAKFEPVKKLTINGKDARELVYTAETSGFTMKYDVVYVPRGTQVYTLTAGGMKEMFDSMNGDYQAFFKSFIMK